MKGLLVWAQSACRSQMALYRELGKALGVPVDVAIWYYKADPAEIDNREAVGFRADEFDDMKVSPVGESWEKGLEFLDAHPGWHHLFCNYQQSANYRRLQLEAARRGDRTAIGGESPCNMSVGWRRVAKEIYYHTRLPLMVKDNIRVSDFFVNYSGLDDRNARAIGWPRDKIMPFGYFPPPLPGTKCVKRTDNRPFEILITGEMTWHRGIDVAVEGLVRLKHMGIPFHATITQRGSLLEKMKARVLAESVPADFVGLLAMSELHKAYETCSVYVGAGRHEPWGMRLNDALNCGAPLVVSRGMGGVKIVDDFRCGLAFRNEDPQDLADKLAKLATDDAVYSECAKNVMKAIAGCSPKARACELAEIMNRRWA